MNDDENPTCVICGQPVRESDGEVPVYIGNEFEFGEFDGYAYHLKKCEDEVFETTFAEVKV